MKRKNILHTIISIAALGILHCSCVNELSDGGKGNIAPEGEAYFSMQVKAADEAAFTRSGNETGTADELRVNSVRVVLYDGEDDVAATCKVEYVFEYDIKTPGTWSSVGNTTDWVVDESDKTGSLQSGYIIPSGDHLSPNPRTGYNFTTFAQRIKDKRYKMLVIINGKDLNNPFESKIYKATNKGNTLLVLENAMSEALNTTNGVLTGGNGILMTNHQGLVEISKGQLMKTANDAHANPIAVNVDRLVAKVTVKHASNFVFPAGIDPTSVKWGLDITNKYSFWVRKKTDGESNSLTMESLYARDPNYDLANNGPNEFNSLFSDTERIILPLGKVTNTLGTYQYTYENTVNVTTENRSEYSNYITRLIVGYKYTPEGFGANDSYYVFNQKVITLEDMAKSLADESYVIPGSEGLQNAIKSFKGAGLTYLLSGTSADYFEAYGLRFCPAGQLYYVIPIRHFDISAGGLGYYGVVRNNIYDITINSITPPDLAGPYLSAEIHVQPWAQHSQGNRIGISLTEIPFVPVKIYYWSMKTAENIYPLWWQYTTGTPAQYAPQYRTIMVPSDRILTSGLGEIDMIKIQYVYMYSSPLGGPVSVTNPESNILNHYYWQGNASGSINFHTTICFVDEQGNVLNVRDLNYNVMPNPNENALLYPEPLTDDPPYGGTYIRYLNNDYHITDNLYRNYRIKNSGYARYYDTVSGGKVNFTSGYQTEPVKAAVSNGENNWTGLGGIKIAIICETY